MGKNTKLKCTMLWMSDLQLGNGLCILKLKDYYYEFYSHMKASIGRLMSKLDNENVARISTNGTQ